MEFNDYNDPVQNDEDEAVEIYSQKAIFWFSVFAPLIGCILLIINLWVAGFKRAIFSVLLFMLAFALTCSYVIRQVSPKDKISLADLNGNPKYVVAMIGLDLVCAFILSRFYFKTYFPDDDYYPKSITVPLIILIAPVVLALLTVLTGH